MAVLPSFEPMAQPGALQRNALSLLSERQSMMDRATAARQQREMNALQLEQARAQLPGVIAKVRADETSYRASLKAMQDMENLRKSGADVINKANEEYIGALAIEDWNEQAKTLGALRAKYNWLGNVRDGNGQQIYKGFLDTVDNSRGDAVVRGRVDAELAGRKELSNEAMQRRMELEAVKTEGRKEVEALKGEFGKMRDEIKSSGKMPVQDSKYFEERAKARATRASDLQTRLQEAQQTIDQISRARQLIKQGAKQGVGRETAVNVQNFLNTMIPGFDKVFDFKTAKDEALRNAYADMALSAAQRLRGQGQITEKERALLADSVAKFGNTPEAAQYIMDFMEGVAQRQIALSEMVAKQEQEGIAFDFKMETDFLANNPISQFIPVSDVVQAKGEVAPAQRGPIKIKSIKKIE